MTRAAGHDTLVDTRDECKMLDSRADLRGQNNYDGNNPFLRCTYGYPATHLYNTPPLGHVSPSLGADLILPTICHSLPARLEAML